MMRNLPLLILLCVGPVQAVVYESQSALFVRQSGETFTKIQAGRHELKVGDTVLLGKEQNLVLHGDDGSKYTVGEKSVIRLEAIHDKQKAIDLLLVKGSVRVSTRQAGSKVRTLGLQVHCKPGLIDIMAETGKSLVIPQRGDGAVAYSSRQVKKILVGQKALVDQKGAVTIQGKASTSK